MSSKGVPSSIAGRRKLDNAKTKDVPFVSMAQNIQMLSPDQDRDTPM